MSARKKKKQCAILFYFFNNFFTFDLVFLTTLKERNIFTRKLVLNLQNNEYTYIVLHKNAINLQKGEFALQKGEFGVQTLYFLFYHFTS